MSETMFQKLEEKMMLVLSELETLRRENQQLHQENATLKFDRDNNTNKLQGLLSLLDAVNVMDGNMAAAGMPMNKPVLVQG